MISPDPSLAAMMVIVLCEAALLVFFYFISRFYEQKFGQITYFNVFLAAAVGLIALLVAALFGVYTYEAVTVANLLALAVLVVLGLRLFRMMTGVAK